MEGTQALIRNVTLDLNYLQFAVFLTTNWLLSLCCRDDYLFWIQSYTVLEFHKAWSFGGPMLDHTCAELPTLPTKGLTSIVTATKIEHSWWLTSISKSFTQLSNQWRVLDITSSFEASLPKHLWVFHLRVPHRKEPKIEGRNLDDGGFFSQPL